LDNILEGLAQLAVPQLVHATSKLLHNGSDGRWLAVFCQEVLAPSSRVVLEKRLELAARETVSQGAFMILVEEHIAVTLDSQLRVAGLVEAAKGTAFVVERVQVLAEDSCFYAVAFVVLSREWGATPVHL
jgi:hypothetical protein